MMPASATQNNNISTNQVQAILSTIAQQQKQIEAQQAQIRALIALQENAQNREHQAE